MGGDHNMKKSLIAALFTASASAAFAADLPDHQRSANDWTGLYFGGAGGYGQSDKVSATIGGLTGSVSTTDLKGFFGGGTFGYNYQTGWLVIGAESDAFFSDIKTLDVNTLEDKLQYFGSVTGRLGFALASSLLYVKGGYAWANNQLILGPSIKESLMHSGWTIGGGLEYMVKQNVSAKVEYMHCEYSSSSYLTEFIPNGIGLGVTVNTIKAGINYHFGDPVAR
jgi:outer membrane immunogenic protein